jgi:hypothetical protein
VISNEKKRVAGAGNRRKSSQPKKELVQRILLFIESTLESEEYVDMEEDNAEEEEAHEQQHEQQDAVQDMSDDGQKEQAADNKDSANFEQQDSLSFSSEGDSSGDRCRRYSNYQKEMNAEVAAMRA